MNPSIVEVRSLSEDLSQSACLRYCSSDTFCRDHTCEHQIRRTGTASTRNTKSNMNYFLRFVSEIYEKEISALFAFLQGDTKVEGHLSPTVLLLSKF